MRTGILDRHLKGEFVAIGFTVFGVVTGLACFLLLSAHVAHELSYDRHYTKADRIYRVVYDFFESRGTDKSAALTPPPLARVLLEEFSEVEAVTRCRRRDTDIHYGSPVVRARDQAFVEPRFYWVDPSFFDVFSVRFLSGDSRSALIEPYTVVLTRSVAHKYFGDEDPMGKTLRVVGSAEYVVTGVVDDFPSNTHLHADILASLESIEDSRADYWIKNNYYTYVVLSEMASKEKVEKQLGYIVEKYFGPDLVKWVGISLADLEKQGNRLGFRLQWVPDIHLHSSLEFEAETNGRARQVYILRIVALAALALTFANLVSVWTALGTGTILGGKALGYPSLGRGAIEGLTLALAGFLAATIAAAMMLPYYERLLSLRESLTLAFLWQDLPAAFAVTSGLGAVSGVVASLLRGPARTQVRKVRAGLMLLEFVVTGAVVLIVLVVVNQMFYIERKDLGLIRGPVIVLRETDLLGNRMANFKRELGQHPGVVSVTESSTLPGRQFRGKAHSLTGDSTADFLTLWQLSTDEGFADTYGLHLTRGRFFDSSGPEELTNAVINETAALRLGLSDPLGAHIFELAPGKKLDFTVIGVVKDFHYESFHHEIGPVVLKLIGFRGRFGRFISVRLRPEQLEGAQAHVASVWDRFMPSRVFEPTFFEEELAALHNEESFLVRALTAFALIVMGFGCWGLAGILAAEAEALGAVQLAKTIAGCVAAAGLGAFVGWRAFARGWLNGFAYRPELHPGIFLAVPAFALLAVLTTAALFAVQRRVTGRLAATGVPPESLHSGQERASSAA